MRPNFKTTAVAILVALGVSACKSNDPEVSKPSTPTNTQAQQQAKAKAEQEAKAKAEQEAKVKAEQEAKVKAEQEAKAKTEQEAKVKAEQEAKVKAEQEAKAKTEQEAKVKAEQEDLRIQMELAKIPQSKGKEWSMEVPVTGLYEENTETRHLADDIFISQPHNQRLEALSPFSKTQSSIKVNLTDITKQDIRQGGTYLGEHKGTVKDKSFDGLVVTELDKSSINYNSIRPLAKDVNDVTENGINYHFINLPYATYGALFTNEHDTKLFYKGLDINDYPAIYETTDNSKLNYIDSLKGDVTYKGNLIAVVTRGIPNTNQKLQEAPKTDGMITLNAYFGEKAEDNSIQGEIDSQTIGKVTILPNRIHTSNIIYSNEGHLQQLNENNENKIYGSYVMQLVGKEAENITGAVNISYNNKETRVPGLYYKEGSNGKNVVTDYNAVFGAEKQPR